DDRLECILSKVLHIDAIDLIKCGGNDYISAQREQWNDGSNTLSLAPGKILVYERNEITNSLLRSHGLEVLTMPSSELSRGRGGPRCMSMPLWRQD
ncbi:MAG: arginine deiminase, partial [Erysipelotrichaceae bacterium]|nr:arginine deiminase [Erysipelotrichaceae bacterium]